MAEFYVKPEELNIQAARLEEVAANLQQVQLRVAEAALGLGPIGLAAVAPNIFAIEASLQKHKQKVRSMSDALTRIRGRFLLAEATIQGEVLQFIIQQVIDGVVDGVTGFIDGVSNWVDAFAHFDLNLGMITNLPSTLSDLFESLLDPNGSFSFDGTLLNTGFDLSLINDLLHMDGNLSLLDVAFDMDRENRIIDANGNFNPYTMFNLSTEGSLLQMDGSISIADYLSAENHLALGEFDVDVLQEAGILDENGNLSPSLVSMLDIDATGAHRYGEFSAGNYRLTYDATVGNVEAYLAQGLSLHEIGMSGYGSASLFEAEALLYHGNDYFSTIDGVGVSYGTVEAGGGSDFGILDADGKINPHFFIGVAADASELSIEGIQGVSIMGVDATVGVAVDGAAVGGLGYVRLDDGVLSFSIGADWEIGAGITGQIDFNGAAETCEQFVGDVSEYGLGNVLIDTIESQLNVDIPFFGID